MKHVHRGRQIIAAYAVLHLIVNGAILVLGWKFNAPLRNRALGTVFHTMLIHQLWRGSRWAQWLHVLYFIGWSFALGAFSIALLRRPHLFALMVAAPMALVFAWLGLMFAFSRAIREFLAHQREHHARLAEQARNRSPEPAIADEAEWDGADEPVRDNTSPCRKCGLALKQFVLLCPECGTRREALI